MPASGSAPVGIAVGQDLRPVEVAPALALPHLVEELGHRRPRCEPLELAEQILLQRPPARAARPASSLRTSSGTCRTVIVVAMPSK